jgi:hypothetical protein
MHRTESDAAGRLLALRYVHRLTYAHHARRMTPSLFPWAPHDIHIDLQRIHLLGNIRLTDSQPLASLRLGQSHHRNAIVNPLRQL